MVIGVGDYGVWEKEFPNTDEMATTTRSRVDVAYVESNPAIEGETFAFEPQPADFVAVYFADNGAARATNDWNIERVALFHFLHLQLVRIDEQLLIL